MHKKFIALIVATAVTITGISASQARAADAGDILGGLAAIAIIGAAINHYNKDDRRDHVTHNYNHIYNQPKAKPRHVRPLPKHVARYNLPRRCLRHYDSFPQRPLLAPKCLDRHYKHANSLPRQCKVGFWNGNKVRRAYEPACLRQKGYRLVHK